ncbi:MAG: aromatic acid exporter family protein [Paenibacillaceae bacterium]
MGIRVIKTAIAAVAAIYIADWLSLTSPLSAGLLAVLGVDVTRKRTIRNAFQRYASSILGLLFAALIFQIFGFHIWVVALFILINYPVLARIKLKDGIIASSVIMFHVFGEGHISLDILINEVLLLSIGLGAGALINMIYMPGNEEKLEKTRERLEMLFSEIFSYFAKHLRETNTIWDGHELLEATDQIKEGLLLANRSSENSLFRSEHDWFVYFLMRQQQLESIHRMVDIIAHVYSILPHGHLVAEMFDELSRDVKAKYYTGKVSDMLERVEQEFKQMNLPISRTEFEVRSSIMQLAIELKNYLSIAKSQKQKAPE